MHTACCYHYLPRIVKLAVLASPGSTDVPAEHELGQQSLL